MQKTRIEWANESWNPASGCQKVSEGCKFCYAEKKAENPFFRKAFPNGFQLTLRRHKLVEPYKLKEPSIIFLNSMSDLFWNRIPSDYRDHILDVIEDTPQHQYQILTKRPEAMLAYSQRRPLPPNFWAGVSVELQRYEQRVDVLRRVEAKVRFLSLEPLLGPLSLDYSGITWAIVGGESGSHLNQPTWAERRALVRKVGRQWLPRPDRIDWVRSIRDDCLANDVRFFFKQWGGSKPKSGGRELDGRTWNEMPGPADQSVALPGPQSSSNYRETNYGY